MDVIPLFTKTIYHKRPKSKDFGLLTAWYRLLFVYHSLTIQEHYILLTSLTTGTI